MKYFLIILISVCVLAEYIEEIVDNEIEPVKSYRLPHITKLNSLNIKPLHVKRYVPRGRHIQSRIAGGQDVTEEKQHLFNHQVRIVAESKVVPGELNGCGGSLLTNEWVITAAHCVDNSRTVTMFFGMLDDRDREFKEQRNATEANWFIHGNWTRKTFRNDIALVKLIPKLNFTEEIHSILLPRRTKNCTEYFGTHVAISGWGLSSDSINDDSMLKYVDVSVVRQKEQCSSTWGGFVDFTTMICVDASGKKGACTGDSGGPMVYTQRNGLQVLIGITSFGTDKGCENEDHRVYTCINGFRDWIYETTNDTSLED